MRTLANRASPAGRDEDREVVAGLRDRGVDQGGEAESRATRAQTDQPRGELAQQLPLGGRDLLEALGLDRLGLADARNPLEHGPDVALRSGGLSQQPERVGGGAAGGRGEGAEQRSSSSGLAIVASSAQTSADLLLGPVAAAADHVGPQAGPFERVLVGVEVGEGAQQDDHRAALHPGVGQLAQPGGQEPGLGQLVAGGGRVGRRPEVERPVLLPAFGLGGEQHLDRRSRHPAGGSPADGAAPTRSGAVAVPEQPRPISLTAPITSGRERKFPLSAITSAAGLGLGPVAALAEDVEVGVAEPVDRLQLVADDHQLGLAAAQRLDQTQLEPVRVLELVDEDVAEPGPVARPRSRSRSSRSTASSCRSSKSIARAPLLRRLRSARRRAPSSSPTWR